MRRYNRDSLIRIFILCGFSVFYFSRAMSDKLTTYVHPRMVPYVLFSAIVMLLIGIIVSKGILLKERSFRLKKYVLFLIPLAAAWLIPSESLAGTSGIRSEYQSAAATVRSAEPADIPSAASAPTAPLPDPSQITNSATQQDPSSDLDILMKLDPIPMEGSYYVAVMDALYDGLDQYKGRRVTTTGFVFRAEDFDSTLFVPARMMMSCCAADTIPVGLMCSYDNAEGLEDGQWVTVVGTLSERVYQGQRIPVIEVSHFESAEAMEDYVYP